ncbi:MAG: ABC transporter permease [Acidobacteriia bacterium]|nr:ABC transporter permease [Terriglobia bacterium]
MASPERQGTLDGTTGRDAAHGHSVVRTVAAAAIRRFLMLLLTIAASALVSAALVRLAPGFGTDERQLDLQLSEASIAAVRARSRSPGFVTAFGEYVSGLAHGDWGFSVSLRRPVRELMAERAGLTLRTLGAGLTLAWSLALGLSLILEGLRRRALDLAATLAAGGLLCLPAAVVALVFLYLDVSPVFALAAVLWPRIYRYVRNVLAASSNRPHVLAARARGSGGIGLLWRHVCIPASPELLALAGISVSMAIGAVIPVETLCGSPGVGQLVWQSAIARDLPVLVHLTVLVALATSAANLFSDAARALAGWEL